MREELHRIESLGSQGDIDELIALLAHEDWQVRRAAVEAAVTRALGPDPEARATIVDLLIRGLYAEANAGLRNASQEALARLAPHCARRLIDELPGADADVRILLAPVLGESGSSEAVAPLVELSGSEDVNIAASAIIGLGRLHRPEAVAQLLAILEADNPWLAFPVVEALGVLGDSRAVTPLAERLDDALLAATALEALVHIGSPVAAEQLAARLFGSVPLRGQLLDGLVRMTQGDLPPALNVAVRTAVIEAFKRHYREDRFDELAEMAVAGSHRSEAALEALGWTGDVRALPVLLVALGRPASEESAAAGLSVLLDDPETVAAIGAYTTHLPTAVCVQLARVLAYRAPLDAAGLLPELFVDDPDETWRLAVDIASEAADRMQEAGQLPATRAEEVLASLLEIVERVDPEARPALSRLIKQVARAARLDGARLTPLLERLAASKDLDARLVAVELTLEWAGLTPAARDVLVGAIHDADFRVRLRAVEVASTTCAPELRGLFTTALTDEEPMVRRAAVTALANYGDADALRALRSAVLDWHGLVAAAALGALADRGDDPGMEVLLEASESERALLRCIAADRLARFPAAAATARVLEMCTNDREFEVRRAAVTAFCGTNAPERRQAVDTALGDTRGSVRHAGLRLAAELCDADIEPQVASIADCDEEDDVRGEALVTLAGCSPEAALARVGRAVLDPALSSYAVRALGVIAQRFPERLRAYRRNEAPPRAAFAIDVLYPEESP